MKNNAILGMTIQKLICERFHIQPHKNAIEQFNAGYDSSLRDELQSVITSIFANIRYLPVECLTFAPSHDSRETFSPHNFLLVNGKTLSIRTNFNNDKISPRVVGQCGLPRFNDHFGHIAGFEIVDKNQIKDIVFNNIHKMLPIFIDYMFISDYTVWVQENNKSYEYKIVDSTKIVDISLNREDFTFTKNLGEWNESTTLKYKNKSIAEIQIHKNRTFKFRFIMNALMFLMIEQKVTTETFGITAEKTICDIFNLKYPDNFKGRYSRDLQNKIAPIIREAFTKLPKPIKHTGSDKGERGGESKCSYDFVLDGNLTLSLKTNTGKMVCPPEVGQPGSSTCYLYFKDYIDDTKITKENFKAMVLNKIDDIFAIYLNHLLDSNYLLWIYEKGGKFEYKIISSSYANNFKWEKGQFSFTKPSVEEWYESNTLKYKGVSIGEFQVHQNRDCYKFRFNMPNLIKVIEG